MPNYIAGLILPWKRFWVPWGGSIDCGDDDKGFLRDPDGKWGKLSNPEARALGEILEKRCVVLSGHPGMGKTVAIESAVAELRRRTTAPDFLLQLRCRDIPTTEVLMALTLNSPAWSATRQQKGNITLVIDGVDEGLRKVPEFVRTLRAFIEQEPMEMLRVVLVCRSAEWDVVGGQELMALWPEDQRGGVMDLCPLRRSDASEAAVAMKLDADAFLDAVCEKGIQGMAARPITLRMLLNEFASGRDFPDSSRALYLRAAHDLCAEIDEDRQRLLAKHYRRPPVQRIFRVACRFAAMMMFCGKSVFLRSVERPAGHELSLTSMIGGNEAINGDLFEVTRDLVDAALETPLFSFRGQNRFSFDHQTFAELLAAEYAQSFEFAQLRRLFCLPLGNREFVVPQLAEAASWLACSRSDWADFLIQNDPEVLLRSDVSELSDVLKERTVAALLDGAARMEVFSDIPLSRYYHTLRHPGLANQLRPIILDPAQATNSRVLAIDIAGRARVQQLEVDFWRLLRKDKAPNLFNTIVHALGDLAGMHSRFNVMLALKGRIPNDKRLDLLGRALEVAVPDILPVRKVLRFLKAPTNSNYFGSYIVALTYHLPKHITKADLPSLLQELGRLPKSFDSSSHLHSLAEAAFDLALQHLDKAPIRSALVNLWIDRARKNEPLPDPHNKSKQGRPIGLSDNMRRLAFIRAVLDDSKTKLDDLFGYGCNLLTVEDLSWLLRELPKSSPMRRQTWVGVTVSIAWSAAWKEVAKPEESALSKHATALFTALSYCPTLRAAFPTSSRFDVPTTLLRHAKARELKAARRRAALGQSRDRRNPMSPRAQFTLVFERLRLTKDARYWVKIVAITCSYKDGDDSDNYIGLQRDITNTPGWQILTSSEHRLARNVAREFLIGFADLPRPPNQQTDYSEAGYHAVALHRRMLRNDPPLKAAVAKKWVAAVVDFFNDAESEHQALIAIMYQIAPTAVVKRLLDHLTRKFNEEGFVLSLRAFAGCWDSRLTSAVIRFAERAGNNPRLLRNVLLFLSEHNSVAALRLIRRRLKGTKRNLKDWRIQAYVYVALLKFPETCWDVAWAFITAATNRISTQFFLRNSHETGERGSFLTRLTEKQLATLYLRLIVLFPPEKDASWLGSRTLRAPDFMARLRDSTVNRLVGLATEGALIELQRIIGRRPPQKREYPTWLYQRARHNRLRKLWADRVLPPAELLALGRARDARLIETEDDLVESILASLRRLEEGLKQGRLISVHDLWNTPSAQPASPKAEDFVSRKIASWLRNDLGARVIVNREVHVESVGGGRLDLKIEARRENASEPNPLIVIVEVKRCSHRNLTKACETQLVRGYLQRNGWTHGIYLVAWFGVGSIKEARWASIQEAKRSVEAWRAAAAKPSLSVSAFVLDCRMDAVASPSSK